MFKSTLIFSLVFLFVSCSNKEQKAYDNVNIISSDKNLNESKPVKARVTFPVTVNFENDLIIETEDTDIVINGVEGNKASFEYNSASNENFEGSFYQGNRQIEIKEAVVDTLIGIKKVLICNIPQKVNVIIKNKYGSVDLNNIDGTFKIECPNGNVKISNSSSAVRLKSQLGSFELINWQVMGRSKVHTSSGNIKVSMDKDISYPLEMHSGSGNIAILMQGHSFETNAEILSFKDNPNVFSDFKIDSLKEKYSHALEITYDRRVIHRNDAIALARISTGNGRVQLKK